MFHHGSSAAQREQGTRNNYPESVTMSLLEVGTAPWGGRRHKPASTHAAIPDRVRSRRAHRGQAHGDTSVAEQMSTRRRACVEVHTHL